MDTSLVVAALAVLLLAAGIGVNIYLYRVKKLKRPPIDYYGWFVMGLLWTAVGILGFVTDSGFPFFLAMGLPFLIAGLVHRKEWDKGLWKKRMKDRRFLGMALVAGLLAFVLAALLVFLM